MLEFLIKKGVENLELISIHVPKTAGISFRALLYKVYGRKHCFHLNIGGKLHRNRYGNAPVETTIPNRCRVLHGHFTYQEIAGLATARGIPVIAWVRNPVERVISNYRYAVRQVVTGKHKDNRGMSEMSLIEYARIKGNQNRMSKFLRGLALENYAFIGITEHFDDDWRELSRLFDWPEQPIIQRNVSRTFPLDLPPVTEKERAEIALLNQDDIPLYKMALKIRDERLLRGQKGLSS